MGLADIREKRIRGYPFQYWVVITLELLERGAYYGIMAYFSIHLMQNLDFSGTFVGGLYFILVGLLYIVPLVSSSLARKYGYKKILIAAFLIIIPTYLSMTFMTSELIFLPAIIAWGIGAGAFKPMVSATIANVTEEKQRNSAYSIYYLSINYGSLIAMVIINFLVPQAFAYIVFLVGAVLILANLIITIIFYKNPVKNDPTEKITTGFKNLGFVLSDKKFTVLLLIYAGFFFLMSAMHTFLTVYYTGFGIQAFEWFRAPLMSAVNPFTIVILGPFLAKFMDRFNSLKLMITGIFMFCIGLLLLGIFPIWYIMIIGTVVFSIGEFITHPNFISYVSKIAPKDRVAMYMGFAFLPSAIGQMFGGLVGGFFWDVIAVGASKPKLFWAIYVGIGLFTIGNFLIYNRVINKDKIGKKASGFFNHKFSFLAAWALIPIVILATYSMSGLEYEDPGGDGRGDHDYHYEIGTGTINFGGQLNNGGSADHEFLIEGSGLIWVNITLTWTDEADQTLIFRTFQNQPDSFRMTYEPVNSTELSDSGSNPRNGQGELVLSQEYEFEEKDHTSGTGVHIVTVDLTDVGEYSGIGPGILIDPDTGNSYSIRIDYTYWEKVENQ